MKPQLPQLTKDSSMNPIAENILIVVIGFFFVAFVALAIYLGPIILNFFDSL